MDFTLRMKTGFFETQLYALLIRKGELILSPKECGGQLLIPEKNIWAISVKKREKSLEVQIQTNEMIYEGLLENQADCEKFIHQIKENMNVAISCEL